MEIFSNPILDNIKVLSFHNLAGRTISGDIFLSNENDGSFSVHSTYYPLSMIGKIFENDFDRVSMRRVDDLYLYECFDRDNNIQLVYVINWYHNISKIKLSLLEEKNKVDVQSFYGSSLFDKADNDGNMLYRNQEVYNDEIFIDPYSLTLISID